MKTFQDLPREIISSISEYLSVKTDLLNFSLSSKYSFELCIPTIWSRISIDYEEWESFKTCELKLFAKPKKLYLDYRIFIKSFYLTSSPRLWKVSGGGDASKLLQLGIFLAACPNLSTLVVDCASLNDDDLWIICKSCSHLNKLYLTSANSSYGKISDEGLKTIAKSLNHLEHLVLKCSHPSLFTDRGLEHLKQLKSKLRTFGLEMEKKENLSPDLNAHVNGPSNMSSAPYPVEGFLDEDKFIDAYCSLLDHHDLLENILLDWPINMSKIFTNMATKLNLLKKLKVGNTACVAELSVLLKTHPQIKYLSFYEVHNINGKSDIESLLSPLYSQTENKSLNHLELIGVCQFQFITPLIPFFKNLKCLIYHPSSRFASVLPTIPISTELIAQCCPNLVTVAIPIHSNESLIQFATNCSNMEDLDIQDGRGIDTAGLTILATKCKLKRLCLGSCIVNDVAAEILAKHLGSSLRTLNLPTPSRLTVDGFIYLANGCKRIERLGNLSPSIPLECLLQNLPQMTHLQELEFGILRGRSPFSRKELDQIKAAGKRLRLISFQ